jgi:sec-independent protein translocase protein TatB
MFDIGFPELLLISVVALVVIGPDRLPETIRSIMLWLGRIKRSFANIKTEIEQEIGADEIRAQLHNESVLKDLGETKEQIQSALNSAENSISDVKHAIKPQNIAGSMLDTSSEEAIQKPTETDPTSTTDTPEHDPKDTPTESDPSNKISEQNSDKPKQSEPS